MAIESPISRRSVRGFALLVDRRLDQALQRRKIQIFEPLHVETSLARIDLAQVFKERRVPCLFLVGCAALGDSRKLQSGIFVSSCARRGRAPIDGSQYGNPSIRVSVFMLPSGYEDDDRHPGGALQEGQDSRGRTADHASRRGARRLGAGYCGDSARIARRRIPGPRRVAATSRQLAALVEQFRADCAVGAIRLLPLTETTVDLVERIYLQGPASVFLRAADALHLACATEHGFGEIYSNDRHLLAAATLFGLRGVDVLA